MRRCYICRLGDFDLSDRWIKESERLLKRMRDLTSKEKRDRLETINSILFIINVLDRSVNGWKLWVRNLSLMSQFSLEELQDVEDSLRKEAESFVGYDMAATKKWADKFPQVQVIRRQRRGEEENRGMYV